jgi:hypothetical protein
MMLDERRLEINERIIILGPKGTLFLAQGVLYRQVYCTRYC